MAVGALHFYLAPISDIPKVLRALVFAMRCKPESQLIMLKNICAMVATQASLFRTHFAAFYVHPADSLEMRALKLEILTHVATAENAPALLRELQAYLRSSNYEFVALTIRAVGRCAAIMPQIAAVCVRSLLELSLHPSEKVAGEAVVVIRALVQHNPGEHTHIVMRLVRRLEMLLAPAARAAVAWLAGGELYVFNNNAPDADVTNSAAPAAAADDSKKAIKSAAKKEAARVAEAEHRGKFLELSLDVVRRAIKNFASESDLTKLQILNSTCKLYVKDPTRVGPLLKHLFDLCAADPSVDIRDRVRVFKAMFAVGGNATPLATLKEKVVLCEKAAPRLPSPAAPTWRAQRSDRCRSSSSTPRRGIDRCRRTR